MNKDSAQIIDSYHSEPRDIIGRTPLKIEQSDDELIMRFSDGSAARFFQEQDCCDDVIHCDHRRLHWVRIHEVVGDWGDLIGKTLLVARAVEANNSGGRLDASDESYTWTFYTFRGNGGTVDVRWYGVSNGYYSEKVDMCLFEANVVDLYL